MSSKKLFNIMLSALMLLGINTTPSEAQSYGKNGVAYVLLNEDFSPAGGSGVYRFNNASGDVCTPFKVFNNLSTAQGLSADQSFNTKLYLMKPSGSTGSWRNADVGYLPTGVSFPDDSDIYLKVAFPSDFGSGDYANPASAHGWGNSSSVSNSVYWYRNLNIGGTTYPFAVRFGGPTGVYYLDGTGNTSTRGTPLWNGSNHIQHPTDSRKIILPSHYGAVCYYLLGTSNSPYRGEQMDGKNGRPQILYSKANKMGAYNTDLTKHNNECPYRNYSTTSSTYKTHGPYTGTIQWGHRCGADQYFQCVIKRIYQLRDKTLDMYYGTDTTNSLGSPMSATSMTLETSGVLATNDVKVIEFYGRTCGDDCIPGDATPDKEVGGFLSSINVLSTTTGRRYGYNKEGEPNVSGSNAALRVIRKVGSGYVTSTIPIGGSSLSNITNGSKFSSYKQIKNIGVSSRFSGGVYANDYIYGSSADKFVVQDSWWGQGGIAYEYDNSSKQVTKYDYTKNNNASGQNVGYLSGNVDAIGIDGDAYLYALKTVVEPNNTKMENAISSVGTSWPNASSMIIPYSGSCTVGGKSLPIQVSCWKRSYPTEGGTTVNVPYIPPSLVQPGDYRIVTVKQRVKKVLERYPDAANQMGNSEYRGEMLAGYDSWSNRIKRISGYGSSGTNSWEKTYFEVESGTKVSNIQAELAVVNIADHPTYIDGTTDHYLSAQRLDGSAVQSGAIINEHGKFVFKVEGYKPFGMGFKNVGDFSANGVNLTNVKVNSIQNANGEHSFNENSDSFSSGYPSTMFEADGKYTKVYWTIYQVENSSIENYESNPKIIKIIESSKLVTSIADSECKLTYQFKDPGRYVVKASITYNNFTYSSFINALRPEQLVTTTTTVSNIKPMLVQVSANDLNLNQTTSYITNISFTKTNKKANHGVLSESYLDFDTCEGTENRPLFGDLTISFDAQFYREEYDNSLSNFKTYDGIGVWDYYYYKNLYREARDRGLQLATPTIPTYNHVYNLNGSVPLTRDNIDIIYKQDVYNPGKEKPETVTLRDYRGGTQVNGEPSSYDKSFIQWALYLRPIKPQQTIIPVNQKVDRGECIASGTCKNWKMNPISGSPRKYKFENTFQNIDSRINVPRDPCSYTVDLEIVYPRVTWLNNQLADNSTGSVKYYSSVVPIGPDTNKPERKMSPIHVLSNLNLNDLSGDITVNQDYYDASINSKLIFENPPSVSLCVRDTVLPDCCDDSTMNHFETTGDEEVKTVKFKYFVSDNNPFMHFRTSLPELNKVEGRNSLIPLDSKNTTSINNARKGVLLYLEKLKNIKYTDPLPLSDREFYAPNGNNPPASKKTVSVSFGPDKEESFCFDPNDRDSDDMWKLKVEYEETVSKLSPFTPSADFGAPNYMFDDLKKNIKTESWVGTLNYTLANDSYGIYDGLATKTHTLHCIWNESIKEVEGYPKDKWESNKDSHINKDIYKPYLTRIDNDPPSIKVDIISQNDNQRWEYQLIEGVNDDGRCPNIVKKLAPSRLIVKNYELIGTNGKPSNVVTSKVDDKSIPGTTMWYGIGTTTPTLHPIGSNNYKPLGEPTVKVPDKGIPTFRTSARLMINVEILDNCGFKPLSIAKIVVSGKHSGQLLNTNINKAASHKDDGEFKNVPRGTFAIDLPSSVIANDNITVVVTAADNANNMRVLEIPINLEEGTFNARVLESKEKKVNDLH